MVTRQIYPILVVLCLVVTSTAEAIQLRLSLAYAGSLKSDGVTPIDSVLDSVTGLPNKIAFNSIHQYNVFMTLSGLSGNEDFQSLQFDVVLAPGVTPAFTGGWTANNPQYQAGSGGTQLLFSVNGDGGTSTNDLSTMMVTVNGAPAAAALQPGESGLFQLGTARVQFDGTLSDLTGLLGLQAHGDSPWGIFRDGEPVALGGETIVIDSPVSWSQQPPFDPPSAGIGAVTSTPEPGSVLLAGLAVAAYAFIFRRRSLRT